MEEEDTDPARIVSIEEFGTALAALKVRSGLSLSQLANATAGGPGAGGLSRSTLNGYFKGRHLPQQGVGREFRLLLYELGVLDTDGWWSTVERLRRRPAEGVRLVGNPYPGLRSFDVDDAAQFFGRSDLTGRLVDAVRRGGPVVVVGPSGSGKSSLLRAGLLPKLAEDGYQSAVMVPGRSPLAALTAQLATWTEASSRCLVVDQLEELFSDEVPDADREAFLTELWSAAEANAVVLGLRADFYGPALGHPALAAALQNGQLVVPPMSESELRTAIVEPARTAGVEVDDGLVELLLREVSPSSDPSPGAAHEQGVLPLLSHALRLTFDAAEARGERVLKIDAYRSTGGIRRAIADTAEAVHGELNPREQRIARQVLLRMVHVGDASVDTRRVVDREELAGRRPDAEAEEIDDILEAFVARRLLTAHDTTVQISHEALLRAWPRLSQWLDEDRAGRQVHRRLTLAARSWQDNGSVDEDLYHGATLSTALAWAELEDHQGALNPLERDFLAASVRDWEAEQAANRRRVRRRYQLLSAAVVVVVLAAGAVFSARQTQLAAEQQTRLALSRNMADKSARLQDSDPALAAELAAAAYRTAPTLEARTALLDVTGSPIAARGRGRAGSINVFAATTSVLAAGDKNGAVELFRVRSQVQAGPPLQLGSRVVAVAVSNDNGLLAAVGEQGTVRLWDISTLGVPVEKATLPGPHGVVASAAFSPDARVLAVGGADAVVRLWDTTTPARSQTLPGPEAAITGVAFAPDGRTVAAGSRDQTVHRFDLTDFDHPKPLPRLRGPGSPVFSVAFSPDGRTLAAATSSDRAVYLWDVRDPLVPAPLGTLTGPASWLTYVDFSPDGSRIIAGSSDQKVWEWDTATRAVIATYPHPGVAHIVRYVDEHTIITLTEDGVTRTWTVPGPLVDGFGDIVYTLAPSGAGHTLLVSPGAKDDKIHVVDATDPSLPVRSGVPLMPSVDPSRLSGKVALSGDRRLLAAGANDGGADIWEVGAIGSTGITARQVVHAMTAGDRLVSGLEFRPHSTDLAVGTTDGTVTLLSAADPAHPRRLATVKENDEALNELHFSPDGRLMATATDSGNAFLYLVDDPSHPRLLARLPSDDAATSVAFNFDGTLLAVSSAEHDNVQLWDIRAPAAPVPIGDPLDGPVTDIYQLAFHPTRNELAAGSVDGTIWLWDLTDPRNPERKAALTAPNAVMSISYSEDGTVLAAGTRDQKVRFWRTDPVAATNWICATTGDHITDAEWRQLLPRTTFSPAC